MIFYEMYRRDGYAGYDEVEECGSIEHPNYLIPDSRKYVVKSTEYFSPDSRNPKPKKKGDCYISVDTRFVNKQALELISESCKNNIIIKPTVIIGREDEEFYQVWLTNFVDCLDMGKTVFNDNYGDAYPTALPTIREIVVDENRWDGSDLFCIPNDLFCEWYCSELFVEEWKKRKLKGICFTRKYGDPRPILS